MRGYRWLVLLWLGAGGISLAAEEQLGADLVNPGYVEKPGWFKNSFLDLQEDIEEATAAGRRLLLYFYQDGCPYCAIWIEDIHDEKVARTMRGSFDVVAINLWGDREVVDFNGEERTEKQFSEQMGVMFTPTLLFFDEQGKGVLRMNGYYPPHQFSAVVDYVGQHMEQKQPFAAFYAARNPSQPSSSLHFQEGWGKAPLDMGPFIGNGKPKLVLFEQKRCGSCDELHLDILKRPEIASDLKQFDVFLLDRWGSERVKSADGRSLKEKEWAKQWNIQYSPTMLFLDEQGSEVFRTEAYLKAFHTQAAMQYVLSGSYQSQPNFQRYVQARADALHDQGVEVDLMK